MSCLLKCSKHIVIENLSPGKEDKRWRGEKSITWELLAVSEQEKE